MVAPCRGTAPAALAETCQGSRVGSEASGLFEQFWTWGYGETCQVQPRKSPCWDQAASARPTFRAAAQRDVSTYHHTAPATKDWELCSLPTQTPCSWGFPQVVLQSHTVQPRPPKCPCIFLFPKTRVYRPLVGGTLEVQAPNQSLHIAEEARDLPQEAELTACGIRTVA